MEFPVTLTSLIFVVLLIVPGVVLKRFYFQGEFTKEFNFGMFADRLISSIFLGIVVQIISFLFLGKLYGFTYESIKVPITKLYKGLTESDFKIVSSSDLWLALGYLATCLMVSVAFGWIAHVFVRILRLDAKFPLLRFNNQWNYFFRGDIVHTKKFKAINKGKVIQTYIDVVLDVEYDGKKKMVSGFLTDYSISSRTGDLETIYITNTKRYSKSANSHITIEGDCFIIPYSKVVDMNLKYVFKQVYASKIKLIITRLYNAVTAIGLWVVFFYPWILDVRMLVKIVIFWLSFFGWVFLMAVIESLIKEDGEKRLKGMALFICVLILVAISILLSIILYTNKVLV